jgi:SAM-dependent methyltransferase
VLEREPSHVHSLNLLGLIAQWDGKHKLAIKMFAMALAADDLNAACHFNIANSYEALHRRTDAVAHFKKAIALGMNDKSAEEFILQNPVAAAWLGRISGKWPLSIKNDELFGSIGIAPLAGDLLLRCALETINLTNVALEVLLGHVRSELLRMAVADPGGAYESNDDIAAFCCAIARQCFINEYVWAQTNEETELAAKLRNSSIERLQAAGDISQILLAAVAAYFPLHTLPRAEALLAKDWPEAAAGLVQQQLREPLEEARERGAIPALTAFEDSVSLQVMQQYEENPYPRWTGNPVATFAADRAHGKTGDSAKDSAPSQILIAGCGTGQQAVQTAQLFPASQVLAVDISRASLAYARRRTRELALRNIEYAQADILELGGIGRTFDRIDCIGVLHHLKEPETGWRVLLDLLPPDGEMRIGLYSEAARRSIVEARARIAERGYRATADDVRRFRQDIIRDSDHRRWQMLLRAKDFYNMSGCRDLLFNVMEHRFTIPRIGAFLRDNNLSFLGFEFVDNPENVEKFQQQFPGERALTNLDSWHDFEQANPETFLGMYVFGLRKNQN